MGLPGPGLGKCCDNPCVEDIRHLTDLLTVPARASDLKAGVCLRARFASWLSGARPRLPDAL